MRQTPDTTTSQEVGEVLRSVIEGATNGTLTTEQLRTEFTRATTGLRADNDTYRCLMTIADHTVRYCQARYDMGNALESVAWNAKLAVNMAWHTSSFATVSGADVVAQLRDTSDVVAYANACDRHTTALSVIGKLYGVTDHLTVLLTLVISTALPTVTRPRG